MAKIVWKKDNLKFIAEINLPYMNGNDNNDKQSSIAQPNWELLGKYHQVNFWHETIRGRRYCRRRSLVDFSIARTNEERKKRKCFIEWVRWRVRRESSNLELNPLTDGI